MWHYITVCDIIWDSVAVYDNFWQKLTIAKYALCHLTFVNKQILQNSKNAK